MKEEFKVDTQKYYEFELDRLKNSEIGPDSKKKIKQFLDYLENVEELSYNRLYFHAINLKVLAEGMGTPFISPTTDDIIEALAKQRKRNLSEWTIEDYKATLKRFYNWLGKPDVVKDIKLKSKSKINYKKKTGLEDQPGRSGPINCIMR